MSAGKAGVTGMIHDCYQINRRARSVNNQFEKREQSEGVIFAGCLPPLSDQLIEEYVGIVGHEPETPFAAHAIDAVYILLDAVVEVTKQQGGSLVIDPMEFRDAIQSPSLINGLSGTINFDENGDRIGDANAIGLMMGKVENGEIVLFSQEDQS